ncbi:hypothetical protein [Bacillus sp. FJAT-45350]|uniref:hypothetical protein n=1 Tax=Bacillus sp. FJAT-45350 TaxID=2011014 RepID=UPI000BB77F3B|nr:hypothetical protein [Bacillus sp. FJAT-45350]
MDKKEITNKVEKVKNGQSSVEIFDIVRPPEDLGDAVELRYEEDKFKAIVFDPETSQIYAEKYINDPEEVCSFIETTVK